MSANKPLYSIGHQIEKIMNQHNENIDIVTEILCQLGQSQSVIDNAVHQLSTAQHTYTDGKVVITRNVEDDDVVAIWWQDANCGEDFNVLLWTAD